MSASATRAPTVLYVPHLFALEPLGRSLILPSLEELAGRGSRTIPVIFEKASHTHHERNISRDISLLERDSLRVLDKAFSRAALPPSLLSRRTAAFARNYSVLAGSYLQAGRWSDALRCLSCAVHLRPLEILRAMALPWRRDRRAWARSRSDA